MKGQSANDPYVTTTLYFADCKEFNVYDPATWEIMPYLGKWLMLEEKRT